MHFWAGSNFPNPWLNPSDIMMIMETIGIIGMTRMVRNDKDGKDNMHVPYTLLAWPVALASTHPAVMQMPNMLAV